MPNVYPSSIENRSELNLRQGIKSSLPEIKQLIGLTIAIYLTNKQSVVDYGESQENRIIISEEQLNRLQESFRVQIESTTTTLDQFARFINTNPLLTAQMEPLQVALELFLKLCKVSFPDGSSSSKERTGGVRYPKRLHFTTNAEIVRLCIEEVELKAILFGWLTGIDSKVDNNPLYKAELVERLNSLLTIFSEETQFKIRANDGNEIFFQQEGIYSEIEQGQTVEDRDAQEDVGPFRIFKRFVGSGLHPYIQSVNGFVARPHANWPNLATYRSLVKAYLDVIPKRTTLTVVEEKQDVEPEQAALPSKPLPDLPRNRILYGPPGSGKSHKIDEQYVKDHAQIRVTFHPDSEYQSFVGAYKPVSDADRQIHYSFIPQAFTNAYLSAWSQPGKAVFLIIEEINRGNCAQIFGDLFQCLDRNSENRSVYPVDADTDLANYLKETFAKNPSAADSFANEAVKYKNIGPTDYQKIIFPPNLYLYATMNTSDQSLFPMDSAFKRRWDWEYIPIDYEQAHEFTILLSDKLRYSWGKFIREINKRIYSLNQSEDKQLGNRFVNPPDGVISLSTFKSKVMFYLWSEIYKNEIDNPENIFISQTDPSSTDKKSFTFSQLYEKGPEGKDRGLELLAGFMRQLGVEPIEQ